MAHKTKKQIIILTIIFAATAVVVCVGLNNRIFKRPVASTSTNGSLATAKKLDLTPAKKSDNAANEQRKDSATNATDNTTLTSPTSSPTFSASVSRISSQGQTITAAATVNGTTDGSCVFTFSRSKYGAAAVSSTSESVTPSNQSSVCSPLTTTLPDIGPWYVHVSITNRTATVSAEWANNPVSLQ